MSKPGWVTFIGVLIILIGGCGAMNRVSDINTDKLMKVVEQSINESSANVDKDSIRPPRKIEDLDSNAVKNIEMFSDSIVTDSAGNIDFKKTMMSPLKMSDYRLTWLKRLGWIGLIVCIVYLIVGFLLVITNKVPLNALYLTISIGLFYSIFRMFIMNADAESGKFMVWGENINVVFGMIMNVIGLIVIGVSDKSFFRPKEATEDYYDDMV